MELTSVAIALGDVAWVVLAFVFGLGARAINLPPMVGFLVTGFVLNYFGYNSGEVLQKFADLGITLLLFTIGLKLNLRMLIRPQVWAVTSLHTLLVVFLLGTSTYGLALLGLPMFTDLGFQEAILIAFALSFSSTVFVVKVLEERGEMNSLHGRIAISILVMQDLFAVLFLALSTNKVPAPAALLLLLLIPARPLLLRMLNQAGHGELLILYGFVLALGGAEIFSLGGIKGDLGALLMGVLLSGHIKTSEMAKAMLGFKDLFLVGFFLVIGMSGEVTVEALWIACLFLPFMLVKSTLFFGLLTGFKLRARTALLSTLNLSSYSEFGLIVIAIGVSSGWLSAEWQAVVAIVVSLSIVVSAPLNNRGHTVYSLRAGFWQRAQREGRLPDDELINTEDARIAVFGMGRIGAGAYDKMRELYGNIVIGVDFDASRLGKHKKLGRKVLQGDPSDPDFWDKIDHDHKIEQVLLALPTLKANLDALDQLKEIEFSGRVSSIARFPDEEDILHKAGAEDVFNIYIEAGSGFAEHVDAQAKSQQRLQERSQGQDQAEFQPQSP